MLHVLARTDPFYVFCHQYPSKGRVSMARSAAAAGGGGPVAAAGGQFLSTALMEKHVTVFLAAFSTGRGRASATAAT